MTSAIVAAPRWVARRSVRRWCWRGALAAAAVALAFLTVRDQLPDPAATWLAVGQAAPTGLIAAVLLAAVSMAAFAEQQRQLLAAFGLRVSPPVLLGVSYTRSAVGIALPGGTAMSAAYAFRQFRRRGATTAIATTVTLLSGVASVAGLALLYAGDALSLVAPYAVGAVVVVAALAFLRSPRHGRAVTASAVEAGPAPAGRWRMRARQVVRLAAAVPPRQAIAVIAMAVVNWLTDLACLVVALQALGLDVPVRTVATGYLVAQLARQIPLTPGGLGVVEASLMVPLLAAGANPALAWAGVLVYRLLSYWSILPIGLSCWAFGNQRVR